MIAAPQPIPFESLTFRELTTQDGSALRALRLEALKYEAKVFAANYEEESSLSPQQWNLRCAADKEHCWIGVFDDGTLIGISSAQNWSGDPDGRTALFRSSYVQVAYRGEGLAGQLCQAREAWARRNNYSMAMLFHREGHWISKVVLDFGATYHHTEVMRFADGTDAPAIWYSKKISSE